MLNLRDRLQIEVDFNGNMPGLILVDGFIDQNFPDKLIQHGSIEFHDIRIFPYRCNPSFIVGFKLNQIC